MSLTGINKLWNMTVKTRETLLKKYFAARERKLAQLKMKKRHSILEPLEERHLLSLTIGSVDDVMVNTEWQDIRGETAADVNASNDVIAAWTAADRLTDPVTGEVIGEDLNVYARYLTDETQVVTIAVETAQIGKGASFELLYGSAAVQRLSFYSSNPIEASSISYDAETGKSISTSKTDIVGQVTLSLNGSEFSFEIDTTLTPTVNAQNIQKAIRSLGADYAEIEVTAFSETQFDITYQGAAFAGTVPELAVSSQTYTKGSTPSALIETISSPTTITNYSLLTGKQIGITITSNTAAMASQIEKAFERTASDAYYAPVMRQWYYDSEALAYAARISDELESAYRADTSYDYYTTRVFPNIEVNVTALDTLVEGDYTYFRFEVVFTGNSGYKNHQQLVVSSLSVGGTEMIEDGYVYVNGNDARMNGQDLVETIKESSPVFRVNSPEEAQYAKDDEGNVIYDRNGDPILIGTGKTDQYNPDVAFADNGTFTVVWQSDIDEVTDRYNYTDIFARRFTIQGYSIGETNVNFYTDGGTTGEPLANVDPYLADVDEVLPVQCVRPLGEDFRVNVETNGTQELPCISCDSEGNFVVSWTSDSQWNSYFAGIVAAWFDSTGLGITGDVVVTQSDPVAGSYGTPYYSESYVAMGPDGVTVIAWVEADNLYKSVYGAQQYTPFVDRAMVAENSYAPAIDFDNNGHYVMTWTAANATFMENLLYHSFSTAMAELFEVTHDDQYVFSETSLGSDDIASTEGEVPGENLYLLNVGNVSVGMDADGDIFFAYQGFGYDVQANTAFVVDERLNDYAQSNYVFLSWEEVQKILEKTGNEDLADYFQAWFGISGSTMSDYSYMSYLRSGSLIVSDGSSDSGVSSGSTASSLGFVDPDDYIRAALSSFERQMKEKFYDESYRDYFANELDILTNLYKKWREKYDVLLAETKEEWTEKFFAENPEVKSMTIDDFLADDTYIVDPNSIYYGMTYAEVAGRFTDSSKWEYLGFFETALRDELENYYADDTSIEVIWRETLSHIYSGDELEEKVAEKVAEVITESIDGNIQALETYLTANPGSTPDEALDVLIGSGVIPDVEWDYFERSLRASLTSYYKSDHSIDPDDIPAMVDADVAAVKQYAEDYGVKPEEALADLIADELIPDVSARTFSEEVASLINKELIQLKVNDYLAANAAKIHIDTLKKIDENVVTDLTSTYKEAYDAILRQKTDNIVEDLSDMTYDDFATSTAVVADPASDYAGMTYAQVTKIIYDEEYAKWPQPGSPEWNAGYDEIYEELYEQEFESYYEQYWEELRPEYTHGGVVDYIGLANAAIAKAESVIADEAYEATEEWAFRQLFEADLRAEEAETGAIREELRLVPDTELREMYLEYYMVKHPGLPAEEISRAVALAPVLRMINDLVDYRLEQEAQALADAARSETGSISEDAETIIEERTRQRMLSEVAADDVIYTNYLLAELESALTVYHTGEIADWLDQPDYKYDPTGQTTRREGLLNQYTEYLKSTKQASLNKTYTAAVKELLTNLKYYPEEICDEVSSMKDEALDYAYGALIRPFFVDSAGELSEQAEADWEEAVAGADRFEKIWTLVYNAMNETIDDTVATVIQNYLLDQYRRSDAYQTDVDELVSEYNDRYYQSYYAMNFEELRNAYREIMIAQCGSADELDAEMAKVAVDSADTRTAMAEALAKNDLAADYRDYCYAIRSGEAEEQNSKTDKALQTYADTVADKFITYYESDFDDLTKNFINYLIERYDYTEEQAAERAAYYTDEPSDRMFLSIIMSSYYAQQETNYDANKAATFDNEFYDRVIIGYSRRTITGDDMQTIVDSAEQQAIELVKETYSDTMYATVDLLALAWDVDSATFAEMARALAEERVELKYTGLAKEESDATVSNILYNAIHTYTGDQFAMNDYSLLDGQTSDIAVNVNIPELFETIFTKWITYKEIAQAKDEIRAGYETSLFNEFRPSVEEQNYEAYREELIMRYTDADGNVDEWSLEQAIQAAIDSETSKQVDEMITSIAESQIDPGHVEDLVSRYMADQTEILGTNVSVDLSEVNASAKAVVAVLLDAELTTEAWALVDAETDRLISLRVQHDMGVWQSTDSTDAEKQEVEDHANSTLSGETVRDLAEQDMIDRENYADDAIHEEVQSSIVYDSLYSTYWNRYSDEYRESLGKEWSYLDLASDDQTTFLANEFSPWYEMTYADICAYLTAEYTAQYPDLTESKIQEMVKETMLDWVLVPDAIHKMTMDQVESSADLVMYGDVYEEMYEKYAESVRDTIYDQIHDNYYTFYYARFHDELHEEYYPDQYDKAVADLTEQIKTTYPDEIAKAAEEAGMTVDDYVAKVIEDLDNGIQPEWLPEGTTLTSAKDAAETATESKINAFVNSLIRGVADSLVIESGDIDVYTQEKIDELIEEMIYDIIENDPIYIAKKADIIGRANAVMEYNLQYLRGEGNGIYFTTYTAAFDETDNDSVYSNGIVNARRDGNNQKYYIGIPATNITGGTLSIDVLWEGNINDSVYMNVPITAVIKTENDVSYLDIGETAKAIVNAFTAAAGEYADWNDGMFESVQVVNVTNRQRLFEGTDWDWDNYDNLVNGYSLSESIAESTYWKENYIVYEITFQGGAHDSMISLYFNDDNSSLSYAIDNDYYEVLTNLKDNAAVKINDVDIELAARVHDLLATRVSGSVYYDDYITALQNLYSGLDGESTLGELVAELYTGERSTTTAIFNTLQRATNNINYTQYDFYKDIKGLLDDEVVREGSKPHLFEILTYVTDGTYASGTFGNFYDLFRHFYVPRQEDEDPKSHATVINAENEVSWDNDSWLSTNVDNAFNDLDKILNPDADVLKYEYILAESLTGSRGLRQINATVGMNDSGNVVVVWQQQEKFRNFTVTENDDGTYSYKSSDTRTETVYGDSIAQAGKLSTQTKCTQIYLRSFIESTDYAGARVTSLRLPSGEVVSDGGTIASATKDLVVTFTENLQTTTAGYPKMHAVDNPDNWRVLKDGVLLQNAIESITFSMSASRFLAEESGDQRINGSDNNPDSLIYGSNQYEAVITFKDGYELTEGSYTLVATNMIHDIAGNAINSNGNSINKENAVTGRDGFNTEISFTVVPLDKPLAFGEIENEDFGSWSAEKKVDDTVGENTAQWTTERLLDDAENYTANSPNAVASDAAGNFVTVWTQTTKDENGVTTSGGIYFKVFHQEYVVDADGLRQAREISTYESQAVYFELEGGVYRFYSDETKASELFLGRDDGGIPFDEFDVPRQASVAMDDQGNFVIVWDMLAVDDQLGFTLTRDVFARRFSLSGRELGINGFYLPYRINIETEENQQNASVAMDADGDFVIVWESWDQDGSGWGVYGRRFDDTGYSFGRANTVDILTLSGEFAENGNYVDMVFTDLDGTEYQINGIVLSEAITKTCANIEEAFLKVKDADGNYLFQNGKEGIEYEQYIKVTRHGNNSINIEFSGPKYGYAEVDDLKATVYDAPAVGETSGGEASKTLRANVAIFSLGVDGKEFSVNETTLGDQRFPAIGMNSEGTFVVTWTGWGQDEDDAVESNIYARQFVSNHSLISTSVTVTTPTAGGDINATVATLDNVKNHVGDSIREYTGVAYIGIGSPTIRTVTDGNDDTTTNNNSSGSGETAEYGTGELLSTGYHVMTAAHLLYGTGDAAASIDPSTVYVSFVNTAGDVFTYTAKEIYIHPDYTGNYLTQADIAIIALDECVDSSITRYDIYRDSDEIDRNFTMVGFGETSRVVKENERVENDDTTTNDNNNNNGDTNTTTQESIASKHFGMNTFELYGTDISRGYNHNTLLFDFDDGSRKYDTFGNSYNVVNRGLGDNETMAALGDSGGPCFIDGKVAGVISWSNSATPGAPTPGDYAAAVRVSAYADWIDMICAGITTKEFLVNTINVSVITTGAAGEGAEAGAETGANTEAGGAAASGASADVYQEGIQIWSDVAIDDLGNFTVAWTSFNQDGYGDTLSGGSSKGLGGIYMRRYYHDTEYILENSAENGENSNGNGNGTGTTTTGTAASGSVVYYFPRTGTVTTQYISDVTLVNEYTGFDQIKPKIDMDTAGNFVISWTSYQNRVFGTDEPIADGIYARQYLNTADYYAGLGEYYGISTDDEGNGTAGTNTGTNTNANTNAGNGAATATSGTTSLAGGTTPLADGDSTPTGIVIPATETGTGTGTGTNASTDSTASSGSANASGTTTDTDGGATDAGQTVTDAVTAAGVYATGNFAQITEWTRGYFPVTEDFRHANVEIVNGAVGGAFKVNALTTADLNGSTLDNQRGGSVAVNANGDMVFVWTDLNDLSTPDKWDARVTYRTVTRSEEDVPPTVTTVTAAYGDPGTEPGHFSNVSLIGDPVTFTEDHGPSAVVYTFSELMYAKEFILDLYDDVELDDASYPDSTHLTTIYSSQDSTLRSVLNRTNWTMLRNNIAVTSSEIDTIYYGLNAGSKLGYMVNESGQYELVIVFTDQLTTGSYTITTKDTVTDLSKNRLDGDYDGKEGGSFTVRFNVGVSGVPSPYDNEKDKELDEETFTNQTINHIDPEVVTFADGSYIIVTETNDDYSDSENDDNNNNNNTTNDDDDDEGFTSDIVIRKFNAAGEPDSADIFVNSYHEGIQEDPDIDGYDYENFAVVWTGEGEKGNGVYVRFYNSGGQKTEEIRVNDVYLNSSNKHTFSAQVAFDDSCDAYLVTWRQQKGANYVVLGKYYSISGKELSRQFVVADPTYQSIDHYHLSCQNGYYGIAWSEYRVDTNSTEVYAKTFTRAAGVWNIAVSAPTFRVNQTTSGSQYQVCSDMDNAGNMYVAWTSTQNLSTTDWDIYMRSFTFGGKAKVNETKVNQISFTDPFDSRQCEPYISVDPNGAGYVVTWSSKNTEGINYDIDLREQLYDYGIMGCAFTADGQSINSDTGLPQDAYDATFVANKIINGDQMNSVVSVYSWEGGIPRFVVAWEGPLKVYDESGSDSSTDNGTDDGSGSAITPIARNTRRTNNNNGTTNNGDGEDLTYDEYTMVFHRCFPKRSSAMVVDIEKALSSTSDATSLLLKDRMAEETSGSDGYYRPSNVEMVIANADQVAAVDTFEIAGTAGDDVLEIIADGAGTSWSLYLNGAKVSGTADGRRIVFKGNAGTDRVVYTGGAAADSILINGADGTARISGLAGSISAVGVEEFSLNGSGSANLTVYTTAAGDRVTVGVGELTLTSSSRFAVTATNMDAIALRGGAADTAVVLDSRKSDAVLARDGYLKMAGDGYLAELYGFGSLRVLSEKGGSDTITFENVASLLATQEQTIGRTASMLTTAVGFDTVAATGDAASTATLIGSKKADTFTSDAESAALTYADGRKVTLTGIRTISVTGNGGDDEAVLVGDNGVNTLSVRSGSAILAGSGYARTLSGFGRVSVGRPEGSVNSTYKAAVYDSVMDDMIVEEEGRVTVDFGGQETYTLIAFDQVAAKSEMSEGNDVIVRKDQLDAAVFGSWE